MYVEVKSGKSTGLVGPNERGDLQSPPILGLSVEWEAHDMSARDFGLEPAIFILDQQGQVLSGRHFVFFNNPICPERAIATEGDRGLSTLAKRSDIRLNLACVCRDARRVVIAMIVRDGLRSNQDMSCLNSATLRMRGASKDMTPLIFTTSRGTVGAKSLLLCSFDRKAVEWQFTPYGRFSTDNLAGLAQRYGVPIA